MRILWLADNRSWAFASIRRQIANALPQYDHPAVFMVEDAKEYGFRQNLQELVQIADVIVAMYIRYPEALPIETRAKTILFLSGLRPFYGE